jgi:hypothetical protein
MEVNQSSQETRTCKYLNELIRHVRSSSASLPTFILQRLAAILCFHSINAYICVCHEFDNILRSSTTTCFHNADYGSRFFYIPCLPHGEDLLFSTINWCTQDQCRLFHGARILIRPVMKQLNGSSYCECIVQAWYALFSHGSENLRVFLIPYGR